MDIPTKNTARLISMTILSALEVVKIAANGFGSILGIGTVFSVMWGSTTQDWQYTRFLLPLTVSLILGGKLFSEAGTRFIALMCETFFNEEEENRKAMEDYKRAFEKNRQKHFNNTYNNTYSYEEFVTSPKYDMQRIGILEESIRIMNIQKNIKINEDIIKRAYRKKAKSLHPDLNKGRNTTADMQKLNEAKDNLENDYEYWNKYMEGV